MNVFLRSWFGNPDRRNHELLVNMLLDRDTANQLLTPINAQKPPFVFHREQLLFIAKETVLICPERGLNPLTQGGAALTRIFLMANDHFYAQHPETTDHEQNALNLLSNLIPRVEYSAPHAFRNAIARSHLMYGRFADDLKGDVDYIDVKARFHKLIDLSPDEFMGLCFGLLFKYMNATVESLVSNPDSLFLEEDYFNRTAVGENQLRNFKKEISATPEELKRMFERKLIGPSDFTLFRAKPFYSSGGRFFCIDPGFLAEKLETAPFWRTMLSMSSKQERDAFLAFTGKVFEKYATWLLRESVGRDNRHNQFFSSPKYERDGTEVCDGIVLCGCDAVFIEYKGGVFTAASKYGRNPGNLHAEIEEKLIRNPEGKRKGIEQLAEAIRRTCRKSDFDRIHGIDLSGVRRIFPLLILRDAIGDAPMMNSYLRAKFEAIPTLSSRTIRPRILTPLVCVAADTLEHVTAFLKDASLSDILEARYRNNKGMGAPFLAVKNDVLQRLGQKENFLLQNAFEGFIKPLLRRLFPEESAKYDAL